LKRLNATIVTYKRRQIKHLKQASTTLAKMIEKYLKTIAKYLQYSDETLANICMKHLKTVKTYAYNMHVYATSRSTFTMSR
jgi:septum formation topological specificity factor MinE